MSNATGTRRPGITEGEIPAPVVDRCDMRILNAIRQIIRAADIDSRKLAAEHDVTSPQLMCLMAVVEKGTTTATEIALRIHLSESTLVGVLERLEGKGFIRRVRDVGDRRLVLVTATEQGQDLVSRTPFPLQLALNKALKQLSAKERVQIAAWMERLVGLMGAREVSADPMLEIAAWSARERGGDPKRRGKRGSKTG